MIDDLKVRKQKLLDEAGLASDYLEPSYKCEICSDTCLTNDGVCKCRPIRISEARDWLKEINAKRF